MEPEGAVLKDVECDDWDSRTIDIWDSVSAIATCKERKRIDHWRSVCGQLETEVNLDKGS